MKGFGWEMSWHLFLWVGANGMVGYRPSGLDGCPLRGEMILPIIWPSPRRSGVERERSLRSVGLIR